MIPIFRDSLRVIIMIFKRDSIVAQTMTLLLLGGLESINSKNASICFSGHKNQFMLSNENNGTTLDFSQLEDTVEQKLMDLKKHQCAIGESAL